MSSNADQPAATLQELWDAQEHHRATLEAKLKGLLDDTQTRNLSRCGREKMFRHCRGCGQTETFPYHCDIRWCPRCNYRITARRLKVLREWAKTIAQPKHLVTTQRNFTILTRTAIRKHQKHLTMLRRSKSFSLVRGGCVSVEITNESRGWHLHAHWLLDARWVDAAEVSATWGRIVGQECPAIVKVKDCRGKDYLAEVAKYVVKGSELASWPPDEINQFVRAIKGCRFFFTFGSLFKLARKIRAALHHDYTPAVCDCGCDRFVWRDETSEVVREITTRHR